MSRAALAAFFLMLPTSTLALIMLTGVLVTVLTVKGLRR